MSAPWAPCDPDAVAERTAAVRQAIATAAHEPAGVRLVAVTKGFGIEAVAAALAAGVTEVGENYAAELVGKAGVAERAGLDLQWHFLGAVQRNKVSRLAPLVSCWQGVARREEGRAIATRRPGASVLVQVDIAGLPGRGGCRPSEVTELVVSLGDEDLVVEGLMAVGVPGPPEASRAGFRSVSALADRLRLPVRSMGMSDDYQVALEEGSTMVRIGRGLFGARPRPPG